MNKQIEEMALALSEGGCGKECDCIQGDKFNCHLLHSASVLYNAGYRKASMGNWVDVYNGKYANQLYRCSVCGNPAYGDGKIWFLTKFCPSCGADMRGEVQ